MHLNNKWLGFFSTSEKYQFTFDKAKNTDFQFSCFLKRIISFNRFLPRPSLEKFAVFIHILQTINIPS